MTALPSAFFVHVFPGVMQRLAAVLDREVDDRRRAAERRGARAGLEVVGRGRAAERHVHVGVDVDAAGQHVLAGGVDHLVDVGGGDVERHADDGDLLVLDQHVARVLIDRGDNRAVLDQCSHQCPYRDCEDHEGYADVHDFGYLRVINREFVPFAV